MGGVSLPAGPKFRKALGLQWGPPGMGGVRHSTRRHGDTMKYTSMGTSRNGRCEARRALGK